MKIRTLDLVAFGPFAGERLAFSARPGTMDLVYGPNEAGKSTTLRAISGLLFGIPERTEDAHRHAPSELRIGAVLEARSGAVLELFRRKGRKSTLRGPGDAPLDDSVLLPLLQGATRELFENLFGLDHERLRASAQALLAGQGSVGESLFAAGVGGRGVHDLALRLGKEADELFVPRARERKVVKGIAEVKDARDAVRNAATTPSKYLEQQRALDAARRARDGLRARQTEIVAEQTRLKRIAAVIPGLRRRAELVHGLSALGTVTDLPADAPERRIRAVRDLDEARREELRAVEQEEQLVARLATIVVREELLDVDEAQVVELRDRRGRFLSAQADLPKREAEALAIETTVRKSLENIGTIAGTESLRVSVAAEARIRSVAARRQRLETKLEAASRSREDAEARHQQRARRLAVAFPDDAAERESPGALPDRVATLLERLKTSAVPAAERVERFARERSGLDAERARQTREQAQLEKQLRDVTRRLDAQRRLGDVPTEQELRATRDERDALFAPLRGALARGTAVEPTGVDAYEAAVNRSDVVADRLRREADRVAQLATLTAEHAATESEILAIRSLGDELSAREQALAGEWAALWAPLGIAPGTPQEMKAWLADLDALMAVELDLSRVRQEIARLEGELAAWRREWAEAVAVLGLPPDCTEEESFAVLVAVNQLVRQVEEKEGLRRRIDGIARDSKRFAEDVAARCRALLPEANGLPPGEAAERFARAVEGARANRAERHRLEGEIERVRRSRTEHAARRRDAEERLAALLASAGVDTPASLADAERRSQEARALRDQLRAVEGELLSTGDGAPLEALEAEVRSHDLDRTRARLRELDAELEELADKTNDASQQIGHLDHGIHSMEHTDAADAAAALEDKVAVLKRHVHRYVRVRLASAVLDREIERYRQANQGPLVARASALFPRLSAGRYTGLRVGLGDDDRAVLQAVRADGTLVGVSALSDGTRDQLYLALRLASLERYAAANEPMPLVLDDILIHFDDERARAALSVLGEVAETTQVLFFTHHARLVDVARAALPGERLSVHTLPSGSPA